MQILKTVNEMRAFTEKAKKQNKTVGFVPTMGYLHEGHLSLVRAAKEENDLVILSIYVNPTQFCPGEDLEKYPRNITRDTELCERSGVDGIFYPADKEMYPEAYKQDLYNEPKIYSIMCGATRPGHFQGVATIVEKLFKAVNPDKAYFGQKDAQQTVVIKKMTRDLGLDIEIRVLPIIRESDGLAMSSRNIYLSESQRKRALCLSKALALAEKNIVLGETRVEIIKQMIYDVLSSNVDKVDYIAIADADTLDSIEKIKDNTLIAVAVHIGKTRLIDNVVIGGQ
ncbi:MAG: pantoate--beta-alanine ligase [Candidatus Omnitrophica bacterium]|nr:pantoate--beta-alanine ligase [Candidatus Omnitrophota bacterium]